MTMHAAVPILRPSKQRRQGHKLFFFYLQCRCHSRSLRSALSTKDSLLAEKDCNVEALERQVQHLSNTRVCPALESGPSSRV